jgi:hypothetical protein
MLLVVEVWKVPDVGALCKIFLLGSARRLSYKIVDLRRFGTWILFPPLGKKTTDKAWGWLNKEAQQIGFMYSFPLFCSKANTVQLPKHCTSIVLWFEWWTQSKRTLLLPMSLLMCTLGLPMWRENEQHIAGLCEVLRNRYSLALW